MLSKSLESVLNAIDELSISTKLSATYNKTYVKDDLKPLASVVFSRLSNIGTSRLNIRLIADGKDLHPALFVQSRIGEGLIEHSLLDNDLVTQCLNEGGTLVFDHINDHVTELRGIQEHIESRYGVKCWIQCYLTKANHTAFKMHSDDHPFLVLQLFGSKHWIHDNNETVNYNTGDVAFYPRSKLHDVHGKGVTSMHLTVAFEDFDGQNYNELSQKQKLQALKPRVGNALPFSIDSENLPSDCGFRGYYNFLPPYETTGGVIRLITPKRTIKLKYKKYLAILRSLQCSSSSTVLELSKLLDIDPTHVEAFIHFGLRNGLIIRGL
ncbi:cupin domain-containing protein [Vibrio sp. 10N.261.52.A1]|uniref:JmjC domain-containing protein n=1 Tax=Vibrio TaxID=662 RepID=UPI000C84B32C|nr:cupin domain-containing protein [Vibrio sp. 10N.261.52.A1]PML37876.1 hypothetical protein BCT81_18045 [Vibrio sp. 10N.261.52.A1]